jgi:sulfate transport system substrate-binding protein
MLGAKRIGASLGLLLLPALAACGGSSSSDGGNGGGGTISLVAYTTPREAYEQLIPLFQETPAGEGVEFVQSYGASGDQARAVEAGLDADVVALSLEPDVDILVDAGLVDPGWRESPQNGMVSHSVVVLAVREGNPKGIGTWDDLLADGVEVITPNPFTSGGARWNVIAAYGAWLAQGHSPAQAEDRLLRLFQNVAVQDKSARDALNTFLAGKGDVLITYENEAILAGTAGGRPIEYVVPDETILIENPIAVVSDSDDAEAANSFLAFLRTPEAQQVFAESGYRPIDEDVASEHAEQFPAVPGLFTIRDHGLGGWDRVQDEFFDPSDSVMATIEREVGGATG